MIGLAAKYVTPILSHQITAVLRDGIPISCNKDCIHITSTVVLDRALYSASVLDLEMVGCFLALQETRFGPRNTVSPAVIFDHLHI
jgi:hypothetical protein